MRRKVLTPPTAEVISTLEAFDHCRAVEQEDRPLIARMVTAARERIEHETQQLIGQQTVRQEYDAPVTDAFVEIPEATAIVDVTPYSDDAWATAWVSGTDYVFDSALGRIYPGVDGWPVHDKLRIDFTGGYTAANLPDSLRSSMLLLVGDLYENREGTIVGTNANDLSFVRHLNDRYINYANK